MSSTQSPAQADQPKASPLSKLPPRRSWLIFLAIVFVNYLVMRFLFPGPPEAITVPYTAFKEQVAKRNVAAIYSRGTSIEGRFKAAVTWPPEGAAKAPPDGYTFMLTSTGYGHLIQKANVDYVASYEPVAMVGTADSALVVHPALPVNSVKELIDYEEFCGMPGYDHGSPSHAEDADFKEWSVAEVKARLDAGEPLLLCDVREPHELLISHLDFAGVTNIPMSQRGANGAFLDNPSCGGPARRWLERGDAEEREGKLLIAFGSTEFGSHKFQLESIHISIGINHGF